MKQYNVEYKVVETFDGGVRTQHVKKTVPAPDLPSFLSQVSGEGEFEFLTVRKVVEKPAKPQPKQLLKG